MKLIKQLNEALTNGIGLVVSHVDGKFEDIDFVEYKTQDQIADGHTKNLTRAIVKNVKQYGNVEEFAKFITKKSKGQKLGPMYDDTPGSVHMIYGPFDDRQLGMIEGDYLDSVGYDPEKEGEEYFGKKQWKREREH